MQDSQAQEGIFVPSSLWIDQPDARERIDQRLARGEIDEEMAEGLIHFTEKGYLVFDLGVDDSLLTQLHADVDRFWTDGPEDLAYASAGPARRMVHAKPSERVPGSRIHDLHSHSAPALDLYLNRRIFEWIGLFFDEEPVAIQSLYFDFGSEQTLHRDPVVVPIFEPGHMVAAWIALEDISPDCGPLRYVPGSHRLPYYELAPGEYQFDGRRMGPEVVEKGLAWEAEQYRRHKLEVMSFTPKRGQVLLWHASLTHGGSPVNNPELTRKSFVVHFTSRRSYPTRSIGIVDAAQGSEPWRSFETQELIERDGCRGFRNPMSGNGDS